MCLSKALGQKNTELINRHWVQNTPRIPSCSFNRLTARCPESRSACGYDIGEERERERERES